VKISARNMAEFRAGMLLAREVIARKRMSPRFPWRETMPLRETAYYREITRAVKDGRIKPPRGPSGSAVAR
jgi:hypothetical protein